MGQTEVYLTDEVEMRGEDDAAAVASPTRRGEGRVVHGQKGIATVTKDPLHEVQVGDQPAGGEEPNLHAALGDETGHFGHHQGPQQQGNPGVGLAVDRLGRSVRQQGVLGWGLEGKVKQTGEDVDRHGLLVVGDCQSALGDVEYTSSGATVIAGIV